MAERPSRVWQDMPLEKRVLAAEAFWQDEGSQEVEVQHMEAIAAIARRLKFRPKSVLALPVDRRSRQLAALSDVADGVATSALIAYHFQHQRPLMAAFLDALGIQHDNGLITAEGVDPPDRDRLAQAVAVVRSTHQPDDVALYLRTLAALDGETWSGVESVLDG